MREYGKYRLVDGYGLVVDNGGDAVMPLRLHTGVDPFADVVNGMTFDAALAAVTAAAVDGSGPMLALEARGEVSPPR